MDQLSTPQATRTERPAQGAAAALPGMASFSTSDVDEAISIGRAMFYDHAVEPLSAAGDFECTMSAGEVGSVTVGDLSYGLPVKLEVGGLDDNYGVCIPGQGALDVAVGRHEFSASPAAGAIVRLVGEVEVTGWRDGAEPLTMIKFDRNVLECELSRILGIDACGPIHFADLMDLRGGPGADWEQLARTASDSLRAGGLMANPLVAGQVASALMTGFLFATEHQYRDALEAPATTPPPPLIQRAATYIEEHAHEPISIPEVAAAVGASLRTLQRGFAQYMDTTPGQYLLRVRLEGAHRELVRQTPESASVSRIATNWGFYHQSRFAERYRAWYGSVPSATLRGA